MTHMLTKKTALHTILALAALCATDHQLWSTAAKKATSPKRGLKRPRTNPQLNVHIPAERSGEPSSTESTPQNSTASSPVHITSPTRTVLDGSRVVIGGSPLTYPAPSAQTVSAPTSPTADITRKRNTSAAGGSPVPQAGLHRPSTGGSPIAHSSLPGPSTPPARQNPMQALVRGRVEQTYPVLEGALRAIKKVATNNKNLSQSCRARQKTFGRLSHGSTWELPLSIAGTAVGIFGFRRQNASPGWILLAVVSALHGACSLASNAAKKYYGHRADTYNHAHTTLESIRSQLADQAPEGNGSLSLPDRIDYIAASILSELNTNVGDRKADVIRYVSEQIALVKRSIEPPTLD